MPHELFEDVTAPPVSASARSPYTVIASIVAHIVVIAAIVIAPLLAIDALPTPHERMAEFVPVIPAPPPAMVRVAPSSAVSRPTRDVVAPSPAPAPFPTDIPDGVREESGTPDAVPSVGPIRSSEGVLYSVGEGAARAAVPAPPPPSKPLRPGGQIREPQKVYSVAPVYPAIARSARIEGTVVIDAVIDVDGTVREARVRSGVPTLEQAALDAVKQWRYRPTTLNGVPVAVIMTVSVRFTLQQ